MKVYTITFWYDKHIFIGPEVSQEEWRQICDIAMRGAAEAELRRAKKDSSFFKMSNIPNLMIPILEDSGFCKAEENYVRYNLSTSAIRQNDKVFGSELSDSITDHENKMQLKHPYTDS